MNEPRYEYELGKFGKRLRELRKERKMVQLDLEIISGVDRTEISRIENGQKNIEFITIIKLAEALEIELCDFFINSSRNLLTNHSEDNFLAAVEG